MWGEVLLVKVGRAEVDVGILGVLYNLRECERKKWVWIFMAGKFITRKIILLVFTSFVSWEMNNFIHE